MFPTIDENLIRERPEDWNLHDPKRIRRRLPDESTRIELSDTAGRLDELCAIDDALSDAIDAELSDADRVSELPRWPLGPDAEDASGESGEWAANYYLECAIARAARRLIAQRRKVSN